MFGGRLPLTPSLRAPTEGMRVVMDLVVNHTSIEHPWFVESASGRESRAATGTTGVIRARASNRARQAQTANWESFLRWFCLGADLTSGQYTHSTCSPASSRI